MERTYMTVNEAAAVARVDPKTIRRWYREGKLSKYKVEGRVLIDPVELDRKISRVPAVTEVGA